MLSKYIRGADRIREIRSGPAGRIIERFAAVLFARGYAELTARRHIRSAEHFVRWALRHGLSVSDLDDEALRRFGNHLGRCRCGRFASVGPVEVRCGARLFLRYLQGTLSRRSRNRPPLHPIRRC